jgi:cell division protein FtsB
MEEAAMQKWTFTMRDMLWAIVTVALALGGGMCYQAYVALEAQQGHAAQEINQLQLNIAQLEKRNEMLRGRVIQLQGGDVTESSQDKSSERKMPDR